MASDGHVSAELSRDLKLHHITLMGMGMMIGAGVFVGIGLCMGSAGPGGLILTFALNGLIALFSAMSFAELASAIPRAGGAYNFARIGFGRPASFIAGWMEWLAASAAGGFYAIVLAHYTLDFFHAMEWLEWLPVTLAVAERIFGVSMALLFVYINYRGSSETGKVGALFTIGQMIFVVGIGLVGLVTFLFDPGRIENFTPFIHEDGWWKVLGAMGLIYVAFEGFEVIAQAGDETIDPRKNIPKAILYSVFAVTITYVLVAFATIVAVKAGDSELAGVPVWQWIGNQESLGFRAAVGKLIPGVGGLLVTLAVVFSATSALNATIYSATRTSYALGRDRMLPKMFSSISRTRKTPYVALAFTSMLVLAIALTLDPKHGAATASIMFLFLFFLVNLCVIRIRRSMGDELEYGYLMPLFPLFPILAIVLQIALAAGIFHESWVAWAIAGVWIPAGALLYFLYSRKRAIMTDDEIHVFHEDAPAPDDEKYRVMVSVANPNSALELVQNTYKLCGAKDASVELLHMVPVPDQVPLSDAEKYMVVGREAILETMLYLAPQFLLSTTLRYCRNVARGIVSAVAQRKADMLILGWHGRPKGKGFHLGSTVDPVIERSPCDVVVLKNCGGNREFKRVLVPVAGGPNSAYALEIATILAATDGEVVAFCSQGRRAEAMDVEAFVAEHRERLHLPADRITTKTSRAKNVRRAILKEAEKYDLVVLGCTQEPLLRQMTHVTLPEAVAQKCDKPLVMVKASSPLRSWLKRWI